MKKAFSTVGIVVAIALLTCMASSAAADSDVIDVDGLPEDGEILKLGVGKTATFDVTIESDTDFVLAMAMPDVYYPGRAIKFSGNDIAHRGTTATLQLTMTGKGSTDDFAAVYDWPVDGMDWEAGTVPFSIVVGVRYRAGEVHQERFSFAVEVP